MLVTVYGKRRDANTLINKQINNSAGFLSAYQQILQVELPSKTSLILFVFIKNKKTKPHPNLLLGKR